MIDDLKTHSKAEQHTADVVAQELADGEHHLSLGRRLWLLFADKDFRIHTAKEFITQRIDKEELSNRISSDLATELKNDLQKPALESYLDGFGAHILIKVVYPPLLPGICWLAIGTALGVPWIVGIHVFIGPTLRSGYTLRAWLKKSNEKIPRSVAFLWGFVPSVGTLAYPAQMSVKFPRMSKFLTQVMWRSVRRRLTIIFTLGAIRPEKQ